MITTDFVPGSPCWLDLGSPDVPAAASFYGAVFGWEHESVAPQPEVYEVFRSDGQLVAAVGSLDEEGARPAWTVYFHTSDAQATARATDRQGGTVRVAPMDLGGGGWMAQLSDPLGAQFAALHPTSMPGLQATDRHGTLCWTELCTSDAAAAKVFYGELFGWRFDDVPMPGDGGGDEDGDRTYGIITPAGEGEDRAMGGVVELDAEHLASLGGRPYWHPVFSVADCDQAAARVGEAGGTVPMGPQDAPGVGRLAVCHDPFGAEFVVLDATRA